MTTTARPSTALRRRSGTRSLATPMPGTAVRAAALPVVLGLLGALVSLTGSWIPSLWGDEAATDMSAQRSWSSLWLEVTHVDAVHALDYALMHLWIGVAGTSPVALRFPSAVAIGLATAGVVVLVRVSGGARATAVTAALATLLLPRLTSAGEEARAYALDAAVATWIVVAAVATIRGVLPRRRGWVVVGLLTAVGTYLFLYVGLMVGAVGLLVLALPSGRRHVRPWLVSAGATVLAVLPIVGMGLREKSQVAFLAHRTTTDPSSLLVGTFFGSTAVAVLGWTLVAIGLVAGVATWRSRRGGRPWGDDTGPSLALVGTVWGLVTTAVLVLANPVAHDFSARYATFAAPGIALLAALGVDAIRRRARWGALVAGVLAVVLVAPVWASQRTPTSFNASDWSEVGALVHAKASPGDQVAFDVTVRPSRRELLAMRTYPADFAGLHQVQVTTPYWRNTTWRDDALTVDQAVAAGKFSDGTVWLLQDAHGGTVDTEGESALRHAGFTVVGRWRTATSGLVELQR